MKSITYNSTFVRYEKKYILTAEQYRQLSSALEDYTMLDEYGKTDIYTIYYDTPDFLLVRRSMEKPIFKEKLRLRIYGKPENFSAAFVEIKRKYDKTVYKRRFSLSYAEALAYFQNPIGDTQIAKEICYALHCYPKIQPAMVIMYTRISKIGKDDPSLRITFDSDIRWNGAPTNFTENSVGAPLLPPGSQIMEIKAAQSIPLWLTQLLTRFSCYPGSFSKYGAAYTAMIHEKDSAYKQSQLKGYIHAYHF